MTADTTLNAMVWLVATQFLLYAVGWVLCGFLLREHRATIFHWAGFMALIGTGFVLSAQRDDARTWLAYCGADLAFTAGLLSLWRGLASYFGLSPWLHFQWAALVLTFGGLMLMGPAREQASMRVVFMNAMNLTVMLALLAGVHGRVSRQYGRRRALLLALPGLLIAIAFLVAIARQLMHMEMPLEVHRIDSNNLRALFVFIAAAAIFNFTFIALLTQRLLQRLRHLSRHDALTGLVNRRALDDDIQREWQRWRRTGLPFALLVLDLDHFKRVNDTHGHLAGDAVLAQTGERLRASARATDTVARIGGEEFVVLAPQVQADGLGMLAERMRADLAGSGFDLPGVRLSLTASVGAALVAQGDSDPQQVLQRADQALYRAKAQGRNRVVLDAAEAEAVAA
ncbi:diguanylate cyclase (GGDEF) domain-containing protein [Burkholderiales bacterium JOSHI_001]|nr:diguanylate cyclase (GGDEF) domain-containing protein [Burkholderiales bacterium JOSHI_001]